MNAGTVPFHGGSPGTQKSLVAAPLQGGGVITPITLYVKNVPVLTAGAPQDIATIPIPAGITRFTCITTGTATSPNSIVAETQAGTMVAATFTVWDGPGATGVMILTSGSPGSTAPSKAGWGSSSQIVLSTGSTLYIRQTSNSANVGTCSFYITIFPLP